MTSQALRDKFLKFFEKNGHIIIPSAPLIPSEKEQLAGKEKVLFTSAGMQPLIPYLMGKPHPQGNKLANVQKCLRTDDIEEVGDTIHHTFFEMLGNWSLGDYWKDRAIELSFKFLTEELKIPVEKLAISVFAGDEDVPRDEESVKKWKDLGIPEKRIAYLGKEANWWPTPRKDIFTGELKNSLGPCGPDTEMFIWTGESPVPEEFDPKDSRWVEVWNDVFMQFNRKPDGTLEELPQKNVDTGMGLERILAVLNEKDNDYETDLFLPIIEEINKSQNNYSEKSKRIIADHLRAAAFLVAVGVPPNPKDSRGSVVHRLITIALFQENKKLEWEMLHKIVGQIILTYGEQYLELKERSNDIYERIRQTGGSVYGILSGPDYTAFEEQLLQDKTLPNLEVARSSAGTIAYYHQSKGIPESVAFGTAQDLGLDINAIKPFYNQELKQHQERSKGVEIGKFKGGLAGHSETEIKYHTATHLLHQALRDVLGPEVFQKGSNITSERLRFDFSYDKKMTDEEIKQVEEIINERIKQDLKVDHMTVTLEDAKKMNAIGLFDEKYKNLLRSRSEDSVALARRTLPSAEAERADKVSIYGVGPHFKIDPKAKDQRDRGGYYSLEFCGGPHVERTGIIGKFKINKEEASSSGVRRIRAIVL